MKVLFLTNVPSPYRVDFFNELGKLCELTVLFEKTTSDERDKSWKNYSFENFEGIFLKGKSIKTDSAVSFEVKKYLKKGKYDKIICTNFSTPTGMIAIDYMKRHRINYYLESDGGFAKNGKGIKEKIKKYFIKGATGYFATAEEHDRYYIQYGATPEKLLRYPFSSLKENDIEKYPVSSEEKIKLRKKLNIKEERVVLAVGQFIKRKGFDILIEAVKQLDKSIGIYIVGGVPTAEYIELKEKYNLTNVNFVGFKSKSELKEYYMAADVFVHPTREDIWGLVINEAMANSLAVITTEKCIAGLQLVENGENGYIVPVENDKALAEKINKVLDEDTFESMGKKNLEKIRMYTIEEMARCHISIFNKNRTI